MDVRAEGVHDGPGAAAVAAAAAAVGGLGRCVVRPGTRVTSAGALVMFLEERKFLWERV